MYYYHIHIQFLVETSAIKSLTLQENAERCYVESVRSLRRLCISSNYSDIIIVSGSFNIKVSMGKDGKKQMSQWASCEETIADLWISLQEEWEQLLKIISPI